MQAGSTSIPMTCPLLQNQTVLFHVLYGGNAEFVTGLVRESLGNVRREYPHEGVLEALRGLEPDEGDSLNRLRVKFFVLLDLDEQMRRHLCNVDARQSCMCSLPLAKAERFYAELHDVLLPAWVKNEEVDLSAFVDMLQEAYLHS